MMRERAGQLLLSKLSPPSQESLLIDRFRLTQKLDHAAQRKLLLVRAPAGYGKTSLLAQWYRARGAVSRTGWISLDRADNDLFRMLQYMVAAIRTFRPGFGEAALTLMRSGIEIPSDALAATFLNELNYDDSRASLVLDDFHVIDDRDVLEFIEKLLVRSTDHFSLVLASRGTPGVALGRLRATGQLSEITDSDLLFSREEVERYLLHHGVTQLADAQVQVLTEKTEGWIAGLQLAIIALETKPNATEFLVQFSGQNRNVVDFLAEDVLSDLKPEEREFLLKTSVLKRFCATLCDELVGQCNARRMLDVIESRNLFLLSLDDDRTWYRYHHLFSEFLRGRLERDYPGSAAGLYAQAARWFEQFGYLSDALEHATDTHDDTFLGQILERNADRLFFAGRLSQLMLYGGRLSESTLRKTPRLCLQMAWIETLRRRFDNANALISLVRVRLTEHSAESDIAAPEAIELNLLLNHRKMILALCQDRVLDVSELCRTLLAVEHWKHPLVRKVVEISQLYARRLLFDFGGFWGIAIKTLEDFEDQASDFGYVLSHACCVPAYLIRGDLVRGEATTRTAMMHALRHTGEMSPLAAVPAVHLVELLYERNQLVEAEELSARAAPFSNEMGFVDQLIAAYVGRAKLQQALGRAEAARATLSEAMELPVARDFPRLRIAVASERVRVLLQENEVEEARQAARLELAERDHLEFPERQVIETIDWLRTEVAVRLAVTQGQEARAATTLRKWIRFFHTRECPGLEARAQVLLAINRYRIGEAAVALRTIKSALEIGVRCGLLRTFLDEGPSARSLLELLLSEGAEIEPAHVVLARELLALFPGSIRFQSLFDDNQPHAMLAAEPLSRRQIEVLQFVSRGLDNSQIARQLSISEATVKWHLQQLFDKLGTRRRARAVHRARTLGLL
jgi:LuxR family transcriptional regulator, maltose regulon positive regulatory protein